VMIEAGNHNARGSALEPVRAWHPIEVLHFSFRSAAQIERKAQGGWIRNDDYEPTLHQILLDDALREGRVAPFYDSFAVTDDALERGLTDGTLALDTRLRDALRAIRDADGSFPLPMPGEPPALSFLRPEVREDALYAGEASVLVEIEGIVRAERRVDELERRLQALERQPLHRLGRR
jgi:hypothetical protein